MFNVCIAVSALSATIINFDLKFMKKNVIAYDSRRLCIALSRARVILVLFDMMHDARLFFAGYYELPWRPNVSPGFLCSRLGKLKSRRRTLR